MNQSAHWPHRAWRPAMLSVLFPLFGMLAFSLYLLSAVSPVGAQGPDIGYRDFSYGPNALSYITGEKPESKLWWNDGFWWGSLFNPALEEYHIYKLPSLASTRIDTRTVLDTRNNSKADVLWDAAAKKLYVASHPFAHAAEATTAKHAKLWQFSYNSATKSYILDDGFPVEVNGAESETLTVAKDSSGELWVTWVQSDTVPPPDTGYRVMINHSNGSNTQVWGTPFWVPGAAKVSADDISSVVTFNHRIGVMWSDQKASPSGFDFATHLDGDPDDIWVTAGVYSGARVGNNHINLKAFESDGGWRLFAAVKTNNNLIKDPGVVLLVCANSSNCASAADWSATTVTQVSQDWTRPIVLIDSSNSQVYVAGTAPESGGTIYYKRSDLSSIIFPAGLGTPLIQLASDPAVNNATSTKQTLNATTGLFVLASDHTTEYYVHNYLALDHAPPKVIRSPVLGPLQPSGPVHRP